MNWIIEILLIHLYFNMKTEHYPSLELCKKLTEIGFPESKYFYLADWIKESDWFIWTTDEPHIYFNAVCPSVMEMIDIIPDSIHDKIWQKKWLEIGKKFVAYSTNWMAVHMVDWPIPNALAEMILWLHENNYISFTK